MNLSNDTSWHVPVLPLSTAPYQTPHPHGFDLDAKPPNYEEFFIRATQRGLNDLEFSAIMKYVSTSDLSIQDRKRLLDYAVPSSVTPEEPFKRLMSWFFANSMTIGKSLAVHILKWVIDLLDNALISSDVVNIFYFDLYVMLHYRDLLKHVSVLLCKLTKSKDVTPLLVKTVTEKHRECVDSTDEKFVLAVLQVFKGFKPHLVSDSLKLVDISKIFSSLIGNGNYIMKLVNRRYTEQVPTRNIGVFELPTEHVGDKSTKMLSTINPLSKLIPCPTFKIEQHNRSAAVCFPDNIEEAFALINKPSIDNMISLLRDETGFFMIWNEGVDVFERFSVILFQKLQSVFIFQEIEASEDDKELLLSRVYEFQTFTHQGIPSVSEFLVGYLLHWDGIDYRSHILNLLEWVVFDDFKWLSVNILRPLYLLFVTCNATMKQQIIQSLANLLKYMFSSIKEQEMTHPLEKRPAWTNDVVHVFSSLIEWVEELIKIGLCLEGDNSNLLLQSLHFYEIMNELETNCKLPLWTIISKGVVTRSVFKPTPVILNRVCRLILRYYDTFLPSIRASQPDFYQECKVKMDTTLQYAHELINMWAGQEVVPTIEDGGIISKELIIENFDFSRSRVNVDNLFDLSHNAIWLPYVIHERHQNGADFLSKNKDYVTNFEFYLEDISAFIKYFSPINSSP